MRDSGNGAEVEVTISIEKVYIQHSKGHWYIKSTFESSIMKNIIN